MIKYEIKSKAWYYRQICMLQNQMQSSGMTYDDLSKYNSEIKRMQELYALAD